MIERARDLERVGAALARARVVLLTGARQVGKTTLARRFLPADHLNYFDLEDPADLARLDEPMTALRPLSGLVVIDEVQRRPDLFPVLRVLTDRQPLPARFLVLGSAMPSALRQTSESLTGRIEVVELGGLQAADVGIEQLDRLWLRGGYPEPFLAGSDADASAWHRQHIRNLATRELPEFGLGLPAATIERMLALVAHRHGQLWNSADPARVLGVAESTVRKYIDALNDALFVRVLLPWHENLGKRQVKSPKVYVRDSGTLHSLVGASDMAALLRNPIVGPSWEGLVAEACIRAFDDDMRPYFWRTSNGAEVDLLLMSATTRIGIEIKRADAPRLTASMRSAMIDLQLDRLVVVYPGDRRYTLGDSIVVLPIGELADPRSALLSDD